MLLYYINLHFLGKKIMNPGEEFLAIQKASTKAKEIVLDDLSINKNKKIYSEAKFDETGKIIKVKVFGDILDKEYNFDFDASSLELITK